MKTNIKYTFNDMFCKIANMFKNTNLKEMFRMNPARFDEFSFRFNDILFDFSKNYIDKDFLRTVRNCSEDIHLRNKIEEMFEGDLINTTEKRAVLHTALRNPERASLIVGQKDIMPEIRESLAQMKEFADKIRSGEIRSASQEKFRDIINIGIGGSDLGPAMVARALQPYSKNDLRVHFVSNVDSSDLYEELKNCNPNTTLFIISSKTFTTQETMRNAVSAKKWFMRFGKKEIDVMYHFVAVTTNVDAARKFGIEPKNVFKFWDWVGGRYSVWSAIGLAVAIYIGFDKFEEFLNGARAADDHFRFAPFDKNIPVLMAFIGAFYNEFFDADTQAIIPYDKYLEKFPAFLQQLDMESNGKSVRKDLEKVQYNTGQIIWGEPGTNAQHSFFQLIHQGTRFIPVDFLGGVKSHFPISNHRTLLLANMFAQSEALMNGRTEDEVRAEMLRNYETNERINEILPHRVFPGNKPSTTILYDMLTPSTLGTLVAFYEHKVFVQGAIWGLNSFDQWGVELGKNLVAKLLPELHAHDIVVTHDSSTNGLMNYYIENNNAQE